jgi:hypothetical protein
MVPRNVTEISVSPAISVIKKTLPLTDATASLRVLPDVAEGRRCRPTKEDGVPLAETKALIAESDDRDDMPTEYKRRLLAALRKEHVRTVQFIQQLSEDIEQTAERGDIEQANIKRTVLARLLPHDAEFRILMGKLAAEIQGTTPSEIAREIPAVAIASPGYIRRLN